MSDTIRNLQLKLHGLRNEAEELEEVLKDLKYNHVMDIENSAKEMGLTNETKRKLALAARLDTDETYCRLKKDLHVLRNQIAVLEIDEQYEQRKFKRWYVGNLIVASSLEDSEYTEQAVQV
jgi:hypothetical protein